MEHIADLVMQPVAHAIPPSSVSKGLSFVFLTLKSFCKSTTS